jgi:hypothetical protein
MILLALATCETRDWERGHGRARLSRGAWSGRFSCDLDARNGPIPAHIESLFPDLWDVSTWNLAPLSPLTATFTQSFSPSVESYTQDIPRYSTGLWVQDDWTVTPRLTLNLGRSDASMATESTNA